MTFIVKQSVFLLLDRSCFAYVGQKDRKRQKRTDKRLRFYIFYGVDRLLGVTAHHRPQGHENCWNVRRWLVVVGVTFCTGW